MNTDSTAKQQGKLKTSPFPERMRGQNMVGQQVILGRRVGTVKSYIPGQNINVSGYQVALYGEEKSSSRMVQFDRLFGLIIETDGAKVSGEGQTTVVVKSRKLPVKWSQWQQAIDNGEVDQDILVEFEEKDTQTTSGGIVMAKIIPARKRMYTTDDLDAIIDEVWALAGQFGADLSVKEAVEDLGTIKDKYGIKVTAHPIV